LKKGPLPIEQALHHAWVFEYGYMFDVAPDGQRFLMTRRNEPAGSQIQVVLNWHEELKARVPVR
jgi:hypothetical protein